MTTLNTPTDISKDLLGNLSNKAGCKIPQSPVIVNIRSGTKLFAYNARANRWNQFMKLEKCMLLACRHDTKQLFPKYIYQNLHIFQGKGFGYRAELSPFSSDRSEVQGYFEQH